MSGLSAVFAKADTPPRLAAGGFFDTLRVKRAS